MSSSKSLTKREQISNSKSKRNTPGQRVSPYKLRSKNGINSPRSRRITDYFSPNSNIQSPRDDSQPRRKTPKRKRDGVNGDKNDTSLQNAGSPSVKQIPTVCGEARRLQDKSHQSKTEKKAKINGLQEKTSEKARTKDKGSSTSKKKKEQLDVQNRSYPKINELQGNRGNKLITSKSAKTSRSLLTISKLVHKNNTAMQGSLDSFVTRSRSCTSYKTKRQNYDINHRLSNDGIIETNQGHNSNMSIIIRRIDRDDKAMQEGMSNRSSYLQTNINGCDLQEVLNSIDEKYKASPTLSTFTLDVRKDLENSRSCRNNTSFLTHSLHSYGTRSLSKSTSPKTKTECSDVNENLRKKIPGKSKHNLGFGDSNGRNFQISSSLPLLIKEAENMRQLITREFHKKTHNNSNNKYGIEYTRSFSVPSDLKKNISIPMSSPRSCEAQFRTKFTSTSPKMTSQCTNIKTYLGNKTFVKSRRKLDFNYSKENVDGPDSKKILSKSPRSFSESEDSIETSPIPLHWTRSQSKFASPKMTTRSSDTRTNLGNNTSVKTRRKLDFNHNNGQDSKETLSKSSRLCSNPKDLIQTSPIRSHATRSRSKFTTTAQSNGTRKDLENKSVRTRRKLDFNHGNKKETHSSSQTGTSSLSPVIKTEKRITRKFSKRIDTSKNSNADEDKEEAELVSTTRSRRKSNITQNKKDNIQHMNQKGSKVGENSRRKTYSSFQKYGIHMPTYKDILRDKENCDNYSNLVNELTELISPLPEIRTNVLEIQAPKIEVLNCKHMPKEAIKSALKSNLEYLSDILEEKVYCERHQKYNNKLVFRDELTYNTSMIVFTNEQKQLLVTKLCKYYGDDPLCSDYYFKVLLPELCLKIFMDEHSMSREQATNYLDCYPVEI